jgi:hypothetical protein
MPARDPGSWAALVLGSLVMLGGCVLDARLGALDDGDGGDDGDPTDGDDGDDGPGDPSADDGDSDSDPSTLPPGLEPSSGPPVILDCDYDAGYEVSSWRATDPSSPRLWVGGVYVTVDHSFGEHPQGTGTVTWGIPGDNVLVLGSYEAADWTVTIAPGGSLSKVVATGYYPPSVQAPEGVIVELYALESGTQWACGHALPGDGGGCEGEELVAFAQQVTGLPLYAFDGCYQASAFEYLP